jgi:hypothetical protein
MGRFLFLGLAMPGRVGAARIFLDGAKIFIAKNRPSKVLSFL